MTNIADSAPFISSFLGTTKPTFREKIEIYRLRVFTLVNYKFQFYKQREEKL